MVCKFLRPFPYILLYSSSISLFADVIFVTNNNGDFSDGSLASAILLAVDGSIIDCSPIAGETIYLTSSTPLPAIGHAFTSSSSSLSILGYGVTIDGAGSHALFSLAQGSITLSDFILQNGISKGGDGGFGLVGGGGGTGGGGGIYVHSGTTVTISAIALDNNQAVGGAGGAGNIAGGAGAGGGGFGGGKGGVAIATGAGAGAAGGGGGNSGGTPGGRDGAAGSPNTFTNFAGAGGGGEVPGTSTARAGGSNASQPAKSGGTGGTGTVTNGAGAGGGAGSSTSSGPPPANGTGGHGANAIDAPSPGSGVGGAGGYGFGDDSTYGSGGGGGGGNGGGAGHGTSGGGGGWNGPGGAGGELGGGGGGSGNGAGGSAGFGAGGGGGHTGGTDSYSLGGAGGSAVGAPAGGGGGSGLGGAIFIQKGGRLILQDGVSFSGNSTTAGLGGIAAGLGSSGGNGVSLGQDLFIQSGGNLTFEIDSALMLFNPIEGAGLLSEATGPGVIKSGGGTVQLTGVNTYLGGTLIQSGTIELNGSVAGDLHVDAGGTFSGNATVLGNLYNSGTLSPGNGIGSLSTTDLFLSSTSLYDVEIDSTGSGDAIFASGIAQVGGSIVVTPEDLLFTTPLTYTLVSAGSGISGAFSSLTSSVPALMSLLYTPLTVQLTFLPIESIGLSGNALNAAHCFGTLSPIPGSDVAFVDNILLTLSPDAMQAAFEQMGPALFSSPTEVVLLDALLIRSTYTRHLQEFCWNEMCQASLRPWVDGFGEWQKQRESDPLLGYKDVTLGGTIGIDASLCKGVLGIAFSSLHDSLHIENSASSANVNSYYLGIYGHWCDEFYVDLALLGGLSRYETTRAIHFDVIDRRAHAMHDGAEWLIDFGLGYPVCCGASSHQWTPYLQLDYVAQHEESYTEAGAESLDLHVAPKNAQLFQGELGISFSTAYEVCQGRFIPMLTLAYRNQTPCSSADYEGQFVGSSCTFLGEGGKYERNLFVPGLNFMYEGCCERMHLSFYYDAQVGTRYWAQSIGCDLALRF